MVHEEFVEAVAPHGVRTDGSDPEPREAPPAATTGSSPSHRAEVSSQVERAPSGRPSERPKVIDELSMGTPSFFEVLRGWRLVQASGLTADEHRDILGEHQEQQGLCSDLFGLRKFL